MPKGKTIAFDLETIANPDAVKLLDEPEAAKNLKDPDKIAADISKKKAQQKAHMPLEITQCQICCFGWCDGDDSGYVLKDVSEKALIIEIWAKLREYSDIVSYNGMGFDVPILNFRSMANQVLPPFTISLARYRISNHIDLKAFITNYGYKTKGSLDFVSRLLLGEGKSGMDGSQVGKHWNLGEYDLVGKYCENDAVLTWKLYLRMLGYYF